MARIPIGVQLHSIRHACEENLPKALEAVAAMGYEGVEFAGYFGHSATELHRILDDLGLEAIGTSTWFQHVPLVGPDSEKHVDAAVAFSKAIGNNLLVGIGDLPFPKEEQDTRKGWAARAELHNQLAQRLASDGMRLAYHNHAGEFSKTIEGQAVYDILGEYLDSQVLLELDIGSCAQGGGDPLNILRTRPDRIKVVHAKPWSKTLGTRALIGDDDLPWAEIFEACETVAGTEWYIVEYESDAYPGMEAIERCMKTLKAMGK